ncbi:MAG: glycosyltransferase family 39 protein [Chthoniobacterales bacterium]|nr:glycosyltransferase family 39 protein [Chthoniobacterales bacterium]
MILFFLIAVTALRLLIASFGHLNETEAYLLLCGHHLDWSFIEGPAGVPALMRLSTAFLGSTSLGVRLFSPVMLGVASLVIASLARALHGEKVARWSVLAFNLLPLTNAAALVMEGTIMVASCWIIAVAAAWRVMVSNKKSFSSWVFFGAFVAIGTQFSYPIGLLLLVVIFWELFIDGKLSSYAGAGGAFLFLMLGWMGPFSWNLHHDWLSCSRITWCSFCSWHFPVLEIASPFFWSTLLLLPLLLGGVIELLMQCRVQKKISEKEKTLLALLLVPFFFYIYELGHGQAGYSWMLVLLGLLLPGVVALFQKKRGLKKSGIALLVLSLLFSFFLVSGIFSSVNYFSCWDMPNVRGVTGLQPIAVEILRWRATQQDGAGKRPFVIAQSPGLAALLGSVLPITYPELPEAPSVFVPESPGLESQFQLWPHYAEATTTAIVDPLYTEEKVTSSFLSRDAFYVTSETLEEVPQTIHGAFATIEALGEAVLTDQGKTRKLFIYHCKNYQMLSL